MVAEQLINSVPFSPEFPTHCNILCEYCLLCEPLPKFSTLREFWNWKRVDFVPLKE